MESDKRFAHIATDPKFRRIPKTERKVKIDKRFKSMLHDERFKVKYTVDKRGRPINHSTSEDLRRYYDLESSEEEEPEDDIKSEPEQVLEKHVAEKVSTKLKNLQVDYARGEGNLFTESSSDGDESDEEVETIEDGIDHKWGEMDADAGRTDDTTRRLAACNMDWDRIRAEDLMVLFTSFLPASGAIESVAIYPSEYGKKRMAEEEIKGPTELVVGDGSDDENAEGSKYHMEKLRMYQLNRLKYYYAVIVCDTPNTANKLYTECDGMEYESSATKIDLRFIPDATTFDADVPRETCTSLPEAHKYKPRFFTTTALQQAKVELTWDETDPERIELTNKLSAGKLTDLDDADIQVYLASSSSGEESDDHNNSDTDSQSTANPIEKYKLLLQDIEEKEKSKENKDIGMEITWGIDLQKKTDKIIKNKHANIENKTPFEQYLQKRKEKRKEKKDAKKMKQVEDLEDTDSDVPDGVDMNDSYFAEEFDKPEFRNVKKKNEAMTHESEDEEENERKRNLAQLKLLLDDGDDDKRHFSLKMIQEQENESKSKKKRKNKNAKEQTTVQQKDEFEINVNDDRFSALFTSHHYNIDPADPHYKKTKNMEKLISEKIKRRTDEEKESACKKTKLSNSNAAELNVLVKSVKRKTNAFKKAKS